MSKTIEAEYVAEEKILRLVEPPVGVRDHEKVHMTVEEISGQDRGDWPVLSEEAGRDLAQVVRSAFGRDESAILSGWRSMRTPPLILSGRNVHSR